MDIETSARDLAAVELRLAEAASAAQAAAEDRNRLAGPLAELDGERAAIKARRAAGDLREDDGARLELLALDREILAEMVAGAAAAADGADRELAVARRAEAAARAALGAAEAAAETQALRDVTVELIDRLEIAVGRFRSVAERLPAETRFERAEDFVALGKRFETLLVETAEAAKSACISVPTSNRPRWVPSPGIIKVMRTLEYGGGRLS